MSAALAGLLLVWLLVGLHYSTPQWLLVAAVTVLTMDAGFWFLDADMRWYVGLSGMLAARKVLSTAPARILSSA